MNNSHTDNSSPHRTHVPNHHAHHRGFSGAGGLLAAVSFLFGRDHDALLATELAAIQPGERVVDVGCGPGVAAHMAHANGAHVIGVDPAPVMLKVARARWRGGNGGVDWRLGTAESIPVDDAWADVVWSLATVHHWHDLDRALAEVCRVLTSTGRLVVLERRVSDPGAKGAGGHGWSSEQADAFAAACRRHGFATTVVGEHRGNRTTLSVVAHR